MSIAIYKSPRREVASWPLLTAAAITAVGLGAVIGSGSIRLVAIALGIGLLLSSLIWPYFGLLVLIPISMLGGVQEITGLPVDLSSMLAIAVILGGAAQSLIIQETWQKPALAGPVALLLVAMTLGLRGIGLGGDAFANYLSALGLGMLYFIGSQLVTDEKQLISAIKVLALSGGTLAFGLALAYFAGIHEVSLLGRVYVLSYDWGGPERLGGFLEQPNALSQLLVIVAPLSLGLAMEHRYLRGRWESLLWAHMGAAGLTALLLAQSRSALVGTAVGLLAMLVGLWSMRILRRGIVLVGVLFVSVFVLVGTIGLSDLISVRLRELALARPTTSGVIGPAQAASVPAAAKVFLENPLGVGIGQGRIVIGAEVGRAELSAHNVILAWAVDLGLLGLAAGLWLAVRSLRIAWRHVRYSGTALGASMLGAILATWIHNSAHSAIQSTAVWLFLAFMGSYLMLSKGNGRAV